VACGNVFKLLCNSAPKPFYNYLTAETEQFCVLSADFIFNKSLKYDAKKLKNLNNFQITILIASFPHLHYNTMQRGCEAIFGYKLKS